MTDALVLVPSPVGAWGLVGSNAGVRRVLLPHEVATTRSDRSLPAPLRAAGDQLREYFDGGRQSFTVDTVPLAHASDFQRACWRALIDVPYGRIVTYGELAALMGRPRAARAVGNALHVNPLPILVPCHRVVASTGIGGYAGALAVKEFLLELEGALVAPDA